MIVDIVLFVVLAPFVIGMVALCLWIETDMDMTPVYTTWYLLRHNKYAISFRQFLSLYYVAENKWLLKNDHVYYTPNQERGPVCIHFKTIFDRYTYWRWNKNKEQKNAQRKSVKMTEELLQFWSDDVKRFKEANPFMEAND